MSSKRVCSPRFSPRDFIRHNLHSLEVAAVRSGVDPDDDGDGDDDDDDEGGEKKSNAAGIDGNTDGGTDEDEKKNDGDLKPAAESPATTGSGSTSGGGGDVGQ